MTKLCNWFEDNARKSTEMPLASETEILTDSSTRKKAGGTPDTEPGNAIFVD